MRTSFVVGSSSAGLAGNVNLDEYSFFSTVLWFVRRAGTKKTLTVTAGHPHTGRGAVRALKPLRSEGGNAPMESAPEWAPSSRTTRTKPTRTKTTALRRPSRRPARQRVAEDKRTIRSTRLRAGAIGRAPPRRGANPGGTPTIMTATSRRPKRFHTTLLAPHTAPPYGKPLPGKVTIYAQLAR